MRADVLAFIVLIFVRTAIDINDQVICLEARASDLWVGRSEALRWLLQRPGLPYLRGSACITATPLNSQAIVIKAANPVRIVQVSDTHISRKRAYFVDNWDVFVEEMRRQPPDLIVHAGDVSFDGADDEDDIAFARREKDRLCAPWIAIPGNHDVGKSPLAVRLGQPVNAERMAQLAPTLRGQPMVS